ncbi:hypothetical protein DRH27_04820 [Candidatus Falkowbacteria bacterium]|nr:MAG: hypothetical protein DRH27_04820 [Candidatus Falkowbacteria bacterium]
MVLIEKIKKLFGRFAEVSKYKVKVQGRVAEAYVIDGQLFSVKGWEGFIGKNGKIYRKKSLAIKYGGGVI